MAQLKLGLLPLYLQFYRNVCPQCSEREYAFADLIAAELRKLGAEIIQTPVCARADEVAPAVKSLEEAGADAIVTLHLAYSPSLESIDALAATRLPILMLDTTPDFEYPADHATLMYNHGIHGVQDLANLLRRRGVTPRILVGHWKESGILQRAMEAGLAAKVAANFHRARVGRIGGDFPGMGDFVIAPDAMKKLGITTVQYDAKRHLTEVSEDAVDAELRSWNCPVQTDDASARVSGKAALLVRHFIESEKLTAFTFNFMDAHLVGLPTTPFAEACLALARGIGYAGEGDVLDAAWVGALLSAYQDVTFTEMFCPDWKRGRIYLSHMGEVNKNLLVKPALSVSAGSYLPKPNPVFFAGGLKPGQVTIANLCPGPGDKLELITAHAEMIPSPEPELSRISGLIRPAVPLADFLRTYSEFGGTHHSALCYNVPDTFWADLARFLGIEHHII